MKALYEMSRCLRSPGGGQQHPRRQLIISRDAQGYLLYRSLLHCVLCCAVSTLVCGLYQQVWRGAPLPIAGLVLGTIMLTAPLVLFDAARASNHVLGYFVKVQRAVRQLAHGEATREIFVRTGDRWNDWVRDFNAMAAKIQERQETDHNRTGLG